MKKLIKFEISIAFLLLTFTTLNGQTYRQKVTKQNPLPIAIASLYVGTETFTIIEITGQEIKKVISLDSSIFQIVPMKKGVMGIVSSAAYKNIKELVLVAEDTIVQLNVGFSRERKTDLFKINLKNKKEISVIKPKPNLDSSKKNDEFLNRDICNKIKNLEGKRFTVRKREHGIKLLVYNVMRDTDKLYFKIEVLNQSQIPYPISKILVSIISRPKKGSASSIIVPSMVCSENVKNIPPNQFRPHILAIPIVPLRDDEILELRVVEESPIARGRNVTIEIKQTTLDKLLK